MKNISPVLFKKIISEKQINIIDLRPSYDFKKINIPNSINIKDYLLLNKPEQFLNKNETYYLICTKGETSKRVSSKLNSLGYNTISVNGGFTQYSRL